jgi:hypothetical protein
MGWSTVLAASSAREDAATVIKLQKVSWGCVFFRRVTTSISIGGYSQVWFYFGGSSSSSLQPHACLQRPGVPVSDHLARCSPRGRGTHRRPHLFRTACLAHAVCTACSPLLLKLLLLYSSYQISQGLVKQQLSLDEVGSDSSRVALGGACRFVIYQLLSWCSLILKAPFATPTAAARHATDPRSTKDALVGDNSAISGLTDEQRALLGFGSVDDAPVSSKKNRTEGQDLESRCPTGDMAIGAVYPDDPAATLRGCVPIVCKCVRLLPCACHRRCKSVIRRCVRMPAVGTLAKRPLRTLHTLWVTPGPCGGAWLCLDAFMSQQAYVAVFFQ